MNRLARISLSPHSRSILSLLLICRTMIALAGRETPSGAGMHGRLDVELAEELPVGTVVVADVLRDSGLQLDAASGLSGAQLDVISGSFRDYFRINGATGSLVVNSVIDRDVICRQKSACRGDINIAVTPKSAPAVDEIRLIRVAILVTDVNDNAPTFLANPAAAVESNQLLVLEISESAQPGTIFQLPAAEDLDSGRNGQLYFRFEANCSSRFEFRTPAVRDENMLDNGVEEEMEAEGPSLVLMDRLDRETESRCIATLTAVDAGNPPKSSSIQLIVSVLDVNDNPPVFERSSYNVTISEDLPAGTIIAQVRANDPDEGSNGEVRYDFARQTLAAHGQSFSIDPDTGRVTLRRQLQFNAAPYTLVVVATDRGPQPKPAIARLHVTVLDINNHAPAIRIRATSVSSITSPPRRGQSSNGQRQHQGQPETGSPFVEVLENQPSGSLVSFVTVDDPDSGNGGRVDCDLTEGGDIFALSRLDLNTGSETGSSATDVTADSSDEEANEVNSPSTVYRLTTRRALDREARAEHAAVIACRDRGQPSLSSERPFVVHVGDVNDNEPTFVQSAYTVNVRENATASEAQPMPILRVRANDLDVGDNAIIEYRLADGAATTGAEAAKYLTVDPRSGMIAAIAAFDYEVQKRFVFTISAVDSGRAVRLSSFVDVIITVVDINDEKPEFTQPAGYTFGSFENQPAATEIGTVEATDRDSPPFNRFTYSLRSLSSSSASGSDTFAIDSDTGRIVALRSLDRELFPVYRLLAVATELAHPHSSSTVDVTIYVADRNDNAPTVIFPSPNNQTIDLSVYSSSGHVFARVLATDADVGTNARLKFSIADEFSDDGLIATELFHIDANFGVLSVRRSNMADSIPSHVTGITVRIIVSDCGDPELSSFGDLVVTFNRSAEAAAGAAAASRRSAVPTDSGLQNYDEAGKLRTSASPGFPWFQHRELLILLAAGTSLTIVILVAAIVCVRRRQLIHNVEEGRFRRAPNVANGKTAATPPVSSTGSMRKSAKCRHGESNLPTEVFLIASDDHQLSRQPGSQDPDFHIVRNVVTSSAGSGSPWRTLQALPPGSKVADHVTNRFGTCGGKISSAWSSAGVKEDCCQQTTLFTFAKHSPNATMSRLTTTPLVDSGLSVAESSSSSSRPCPTWQDDHEPTAISCKWAADVAAIGCEPDEALCLLGFSPLHQQQQQQQQHQLPGIVYRALTPSFDLQSSCSSFDTRQTEINRLLDMLKRDTETATNNSLFDHHQQQSMSDVDAERDGNIAFIDGDCTARCRDVIDDECASNDDNTSVDMADSGIDAPSETSFSKTK